jgi:hypothetical protein
VVLVDGAWKMLSIMRWNVAGELVRPKNMTFGTKMPNSVLKAALWRSSSPNADVIVALAHIELGEDAGILDASNSWGE